MCIKQRIDQYKWKYSNKIINILLIRRYWSLEKVNKMRLKYTLTELLEWKEKFILVKLV